MGINRTASEALRQPNYWLGVGLYKERLRTPDGAVIVQAWGGKAAFPAWGKTFAALNLHYAELHGYDYALYRFDECHHPQRGRVAPDWCKVAALRSALLDFPRASWVLLLDLDVVVRNVSLDLVTVTKRSPMTNDPKCNIATTGSKPDDVGIFAFANPFLCNVGTTEHKGEVINLTPHTGALIVRRGNAASRVINTWWYNAGSTEHWGIHDGLKEKPDQSVFVYPLYHIYGGAEIVLLMDNQFHDRPMQWLHHRCRSCNWLPSRARTAQLLRQETNRPALSKASSKLNSRFRALNPLAF